MQPYSPKGRTIIMSISLLAPAMVTFDGTLPPNITPTLPPTITPTLPQDRGCWTPRNWDGSIHLPSPDAGIQSVDGAALLA